MATIRKRRYQDLRKKPLDPLQKLCGYWKNGFESPPLRIFRATDGYRICFEYPLHQVTIPINGMNNIYSVFLFGRMEIAYDGINDRLLIAEEGIYFRDYERDEEESI